MLIKKSENCRNLVYKATNQHIGLANIEKKKTHQSCFQILKVVMKTWASRVLTTILYPIYHTSIYSSILLSTCNWFFIIGNHLLQIITLVMSFLSWYCHIEVWPPLVVKLLKITLVQILSSHAIIEIFWHLLLIHIYYMKLYFTVICPPNDFHAVSSHNVIYKSVYTFSHLWQRSAIEEWILCTIQA